jgi:hypothetical protein
MIRVPKKNDLYLKDYKGQLWFLLILHYYSCNEFFMPIDKMMSCSINTYIIK